MTQSVMQSSTMQSALAPAGAHAERIGDLTWVLAAGAAAITAFVFILLWYAISRGPSPVNERRWLIGGGIVFPAVVLVAILVYALIVTNALVARESDTALIIHVTGKRWWWEVRYVPSGSNGISVTSANEIHIPTGRDVKLLLDTDDVIHSFWVPSLSGKVDMIPGRTNRLVINAGKAGTYRGQCAEFCGTQHANMSLYVVAHEPAEFERWLQREARPAVAAGSSAPTQTGKILFGTAGCARCHAIRGTSSAGRLGPDLTHVASRVALGAGTLRNNEGNMAGWIAGSQSLKPGNLMPSVALGPAQLHALTAYMQSLE